VGNAFRFDGVTWSAAVPVDRACASEEGCGLIVSCPTTTFCAAIDRAGQTFAYNGSDWSSLSMLQATNSTDSFTALSCAASNFCVTVDDGGGAFTFDGTAWSGRVAIDQAPALLAVSCPTTHFCAAFSQDDDFVINRGAGWVVRPSLNLPTPEGGSEPNDPAAISCATATLCVGLDSFGHGYVYRGKQWSNPARLDNNQNGNAAASCPSEKFCVAVDDSGSIFQFDGKAWSKQTSLKNSNAGLNSVSCPTTRSCVALDNNNRYLRYTSR